MEEVSAQSDGGGEGTVRRKRQTLLATGATCCAMIGEGGDWGSRRREAGGGFRMVNTCIPMADSCQCMAKITTIL